MKSRPGERVDKPSCNSFNMALAINKHRKKFQNIRETWFTSLLTRFHKRRKVIVFGKWDVHYKSLFCLSPNMKKGPWAKSGCFSDHEMYVWNAKTMWRTAAPLPIFGIAILWRNLGSPNGCGSWWIQQWRRRNVRKQNIGASTRLDSYSRRTYALTILTT